MLNLKYLIKMDVLFSGHWLAKQLLFTCLLYFFAMVISCRISSFWFWNGFNSEIILCSDIFFYSNWSLEYFQVIVYLKWSVEEKSICSIYFYTINPTVNRASIVERCIGANLMFCLLKNISEHLSVLLYKIVMYVCLFAFK